MRNGRPLLVRPTIPEAYHWVPVAGISPEKASLDAHVASQLYQMATHPDVKLTETQRRKAAIVLGVSRAVMTMHYRLTPGDFIEGELAGPYLNARTTGDNRVEYYATVPLGDPNRHILLTPPEFTDEEKAVIATLLPSSLGALPLQGHSIIMTGRHYISDANGPSRKAFSIVEKQFWRSAAVREYFASDMEMMQDVSWHKAGHPVSMNLKQTFATDERIPIMLRKAGVGSAACRLPAMEPQIRAASSYVTLMDMVTFLFERFGGKADAGELSNVVRELKNVVRELKNVVRELKAWRREDERYKIPGEWPETVTKRSEGLTWLREILQRNAPKVAYSYGFYCALAEQIPAMSEASGGYTLRTLYSLSKLKENCPAAFLEGTLAHGDFAAARNRRQMEGEFTAVQLTLTLD